jgi:lysophospholipase L1-like esterase
MIENWIFLGDSLTEGVGRTRMSYVQALVQEVRKIHGISASNAWRVQYVRLKRADPSAVSGFVETNIIGNLDPCDGDAENSLCIWNLAAEATTIDTDNKWLFFIQAIKPSRIILFRGSLENVLRPGYVIGGQWPWWVLPAWRHYAAMDPRCYFSTTWWRKVKQVALDRVRQQVRLGLLRRTNACALQTVEEFTQNFSELLPKLVVTGSKITILGLLPISNRTFPGSQRQFTKANRRISDLAEQHGVEFLDWSNDLDIAESIEALYFRDGFHPNEKGAAVLGAYLASKFRLPGNAV